DQAYQLLGTPGNITDRVFPNVEYSAWMNTKLKHWALRAGIRKNITFHSFRHTYATLQLSMGTSLYTIKELLGHKDIQTTQIYARILSESKIEAANKIRIDLPRTSTRPLINAVDSGDI